MSQLQAGHAGAFESRHSIASILAPVEVPEEQLAKVRASQIESIDRLGILVVLTNLLNAALVLVAFSGTSVNGMLGVWGSALCLFCAGLFLRTTISLDRPGRRRNPNVLINRYALAALLLGLIWGALPLLMLPHLAPFGQMALGVILCAMIFGGALIASSLPRAAYAFAFPIAAGLNVGYFMLAEAGSHQLALIAVVYAAIVTVCVRWNYNRFVLQYLNKVAVGQQNALIGLLLRDFEESTSDWLWQTDRFGTLQELPLVLKGAKSGYELMSPGQPLLNLFELGEARNVLSACLHRRQGFRDLVLRVNQGQAVCWWSLTGKPLIEGGQFRGFRGVASDVTQSKEIEDRIAFMAHYDGLTGLPNRATFQERFERICQQPLHRGTCRAVVLLDLDNFKWVNDTLGHPTGDELLRQVAERLGECTSSADTVARLGGDEFALIVERESRAALEAMFDTLVNRLSHIYEIRGSTANCGASLGVRIFEPEGNDPQTLFTHADLALYQAKKKGKGHWCLFTQDLDEKARARRIIESDLQAALRQNELHLKFQPIVSARTGAIVACETLMRWEHPQRGPIMPADFIEHAEDCGLITRMGDWVIREALVQARRLPRDVRLSINISPLQLHSSSLMTTIVNALAANGVDPSRLDLEITESILLSDTAFVLERLTHLRELGLCLSLDDFGTGFSSLSYLRSFPFNKIKIDKSFVSEIETSEDSRVITKATIGLAHSLGMSCTAEGVETEAQRDFLLAHGCDELQGFHISEPRTLDELQRLVGLPLVQPGETDTAPPAQTVTVLAEALSARPDGAPRELEPLASGRD